MEQNYKYVTAALRIVLTIPGLHNREEVTRALHACEIDSPVALERARRALTRALKFGDVDHLPDNLRQLCDYAIDNIAAKPGPLPEFSGKKMLIQLRVESERKTAYMRAAHKQNMSLSRWMLSLCDREAGVELE